MRAVIQRVSNAAVKVDGKTVGSIGPGVVVLLGVGRDDSQEDGEWLAEKTAQLRIFPDNQGNMNRSLLDIGGQALVVSQFTLYGDCRKGRRPSFSSAAPPAMGDELYSFYCDELEARGITVARGIFGAMMKVRLENDGPVTLLLDSKKTF